MDHSFYNTRCTTDSGYILAILWGFLAPQPDSGCSCPHQHAISVQVVSQIPQTNLGLHPNQTDGPNDQVSRPLGLDPEDVFHTTPNPGPSSISLGLSLRQFLMPASFALKIPLFKFMKGKPLGERKNRSEERTLKKCRNQLLIVPLALSEQLCSNSAVPVKDEGRRESKDAASFRCSGAGVQEHRISNLQHRHEILGNLPALTGMNGDNHDSFLLIFVEHLVH